MRRICSFVLVGLAFVSLAYTGAAQAVPAFARREGVTCQKCHFRPLSTPGFYILAGRLLSDRWAAYGRYVWLRRELVAGGSQHIAGPTLGVSWWAQTEVRLTLEGQLLSTTGSPQSRALMSELLWIF